MLDMMTFRAGGRAKLPTPRTAAYSSCGKTSSGFDVVYNRGNVVVSPFNPEQILQFKVRRNVWRISKPNK